MIRSIKNLYHFFVAVLAIIVYRYPAKNLVVIGVTGTDGKSTTTHLIASILGQAGKKVALTSTVGTKINEQEKDFGLHVTTPSSFQIQKFLREVVRQEIPYVILEASSHGLDQFRLLGCNFKIGVLTNVTKEHLDYHGTWKKYMQAKSKLFKKIKVAVLNADDPSFSFFRDTAEKAQVVSYGLEKGDVNLKNFKFKTNLLGTHNLYNSLAAAACAKALGIDEEEIKIGLEKFTGIPGRLEEISEGQSFKVFVDFAHTPAAFETVLSSLKKETKGKLIHVFGCTGKRDRSKRPIMGELSSKYTDEIILTSEDTYGEPIGQILSEIIKGIPKSQNYQTIDDRGLAIAKALELAKKNDIVIITGVGHQKSLNLGDKEIPWSDQEQVKKLLKNKYE